MLLAIISKKNNNYKDKINYELYKNNLSFSYFKELYNHYLGGVYPLNNISSSKTESVFEEKLKYLKISPYQEGAQLEVTKNYSVPNQEAGVVVYIGEKENYGNVIIIEGLKDIDTWYGNICNSTLKLYDYVEKGTYIGESCNENLYLVYSKDNNFLNYKNYIS